MDYIPIMGIAFVIFMVGFLCYCCYSCEDDATEEMEDRKEERLRQRELEYELEVQRRQEQFNYAQGQQRHTPSYPPNPIAPLSNQPVPTQPYPTNSVQLNPIQPYPSQPLPTQPYPNIGQSSPIHPYLSPSVPNQLNQEFSNDSHPTQPLYPLETQSSPSSPVQTPIMSTAGCSVDPPVQTTSNNDTSSFPTEIFNKVKSFAFGKRWKCWCLFLIWVLFVELLMVNIQFVLSLILRCNIMTCSLSCSVSNAI